MTLKQAMKLKPGDIVIERGTAAPFRFVDIKEVTTYGIVGGQICKQRKRKQLRCEKIPGEYYPDCRKQDVPYYFSPLRVMGKEVPNG